MNHVYDAKSKNLSETACQRGEKCGLTSSSHPEFNFAVWQAVSLKFLLFAVVISGVFRGGSPGAQCA